MDLYRPLGERTEHSVTAIITTHNRIDLLPRAIKSVFNQTYEDIDLIVVDDASTDHTQEYMKSLADKYDWISYIRISPEDTKGVNYARNVGIKAAKGNLVAFLDDDDEWLPNKTSVQVEFFERYPHISAVSSDWTDAYCFKDKKYRIDFHHQFNTGRNEFFVTPYLGRTSTIMAFKSRLIEIDGFDIALPELHEVDLAYRICMASAVVYIKKPLIVYYHYLNSNFLSKEPSSYISALQLVEEKYAAQLAKLTEDQRKRRKNQSTLDIAERHLYSGNNSGYRKTVRPLLSIRERGMLVKYILSYFLSGNAIIRLVLLKKRVNRLLKR
jgi:glycosyltransferase involved in cell wall biosynthesis